MWFADPSSCYLLQWTIALHRAAQWCKGFTISAQWETPLKGRLRSTVLLAAGGSMYGLKILLPNLASPVSFHKYYFPKNLLYSLLSLSIYFPEDQTDTRVTQICPFQTSSSTFSPCCFCDSSRKIKDFISIGISFISTSEVPNDSSVGSGLARRTPSTLDLFKVFCLSKLNATEAQMLCYRHH